jgi:hypothetical protein
MEKIKKSGLIITSVILFAACGTNYTCECKYSYWDWEGNLNDNGLYRFESAETPCEDFEGSTGEEGALMWDNTLEKYYECYEID